MPFIHGQEVMISAVDDDEIDASGGKKMDSGRHENVSNLVVGGAKLSQRKESAIKDRKSLSEYF
jgi:hypothetical protein